MRRPPVSSGRAAVGQRCGVRVDGHGGIVPQRPGRPPTPTGRGGALGPTPSTVWVPVQGLTGLAGPALGRAAGALLVLEVDRDRTMAQAGLPAAHRGRGARPRRGAGDPRQQPPVLRRLAVHAAHAAAPRHVRGQGRVLQHPGHQGLVPAEVLLRRRPGARSTGRAPPPPRAPCPRPSRILDDGETLRHLSRGHPVPRRPALPRQDRGRSPRPRDRACRSSPSR